MRGAQFSQRLTGACARACARARLGFARRRLRCLDARIARTPREFSGSCECPRRQSTPAYLAFHSCVSRHVQSASHSDAGFHCLLNLEKSTQRFRNLNSIPAGRIRVVIHRNKSTAVRLRGRLPSKFGSSQVCADADFRRGENGRSNAFLFQMQICINRRLDVTRERTRRAYASRLETCSRPRSRPSTAARTDDEGHSHDGSSPPSVSSPCSSESWSAPIPTAAKVLLLCSATTRRRGTGWSSRCTPHWPSGTRTHR